MKSGDKIKILYIVPHRSVAGGAEQTLLILLKHLNKEKFYPIVIIPDGSMYKKFNDMGIKTYVSDTDYLWFPNQRHYYRLLQGLKERLKQVVEILEQEGIDIIHTNDYWAFDGGLASRLTSIPHVWHLHIPLMSTHPVFRYFPLQTSSFGAIINELSDVIVAVSSGAMESLKPYVPQDKIKIIYNGIELEKFKKGTGKNVLLQELGISKDSYVVTSVGRVCRQKCFEDFVECAGIVFKERQDVKFLLVGPTNDDKSRAEFLKRRVKELGLEQHFFFLGRRDDVPAILSDSDIFVSSSLYEGHPLVVLEAMASGKPVVATRCIGSEEGVVDGETGYLVEINKPEELAKAVLKLLDDDNARKLLGIKGRERLIESFSLTSFVKNFESLYLDIYKNGKKQKEPAIWPEFVVNVLNEIGELGLRSLKQEWRLKQLENFMSQFKNNFLYQGARKVYKVFSGTLNKKDNHHE